MLLRNILVLLIAAHGIGHILFLVPLLGIADWGQSTQSWLLKDATLLRLLGSLLWIAAIIGFCAGAYGLFSQQSWWRTFAVVAAVVSVLGLLLFWANPVSSPMISALLFDLAVIGLLLIMHLPSVETVGA